MSAFDQAASSAAQYGGNFGQALAQQAAQSILGTPVQPTVDAVAQDVTPSATPQIESGDVGDM